MLNFVEIKGLGWFLGMSSVKLRPWTVFESLSSNIYSLFDVHKKIISINKRVEKISADDVLEILIKTNLQLQE